jgi:hypothetical protein
MATAAEIQTQLDEVNAAISKILTGAQKYTHSAGVSKEMASLSELRAFKRELEGELAKVSRGGLVVKWGMPGR